MSVSRDEAVALGEGMTAGPWSTGGYHFPSGAITLLLDGAEVGDIPLDQSDRIVQALNLGALAPRLRETVVELHDRVAELEREVNRLRDHLHVIERAEGVDADTLRRWAFESSLGDRPILPPSEVQELAREVDRLRSRLAEAQRQIEEIKP